MRQTPKILVVDDEQIVCESCQRVLVGEGYSVRTVTKAEEAVSLLARQHFDVVLLDLKMPGFSGLNLLRMIRKMKPTTDIVVITGYPSLENAKESIRLGAFDYFIKPFAPQALCEIVSQVLTCKPWKVQERYEHGV